MSAHQFYVDQLMAGNKNLQHASLEEIDLSNKTFTGVDFTSANLSETTLNGTTFKNCIFNGANLEGCNLQNASFIDCKMLTSQLEGSKGNANFIKCSLSYANLKNSKIDGTHFLFSDLTGAFFNGTSLRNATFDGDSLQQADFRDANLQRAGLIECNFRDAEFKNTNMSKIIASGNKNITLEQLEGFKDSEYTSTSIIRKFLQSNSHPNVYMITKYNKGNQSVEIINVETMKKYKRKLRVSGDLKSLYVKDKLGNAYYIVDKRPKSVPYI